MDEDSMNEEQAELSCEEFQRLLPDLFTSNDDVDLHPHVRSCSLCRALVEDLYLIAEEARYRRFGGGS
jgi:hypothetical protein